MRALILRAATEFRMMRPGEAVMNSDLGKVLMGLGGVLFAVGATLWLLPKLGFRGVPGDLGWESGNVRFYAPIGTCILLSLLVSVALWLWQTVQRR